MAESLTIARPYAEAAFKLAQELGQLPSWSDALSRLATVAGTDVARDLIGNPGLSDDRLAGLLADAAGELTPEQRNFVQVLASNERFAVMSEIASQFESLRHAHEGVLEAQVASAYPLTNEQRGEIIAALEERLGRKVQATVVVEPELIGGVSIRIGDEVMDASVRGKLAKLAGALKV